MIRGQPAYIRVFIYIDEPHSVMLKFKAESSDQVLKYMQKIKEYFSATPNMRNFSMEILDDEHLWRSRELAAAMPLEYVLPLMDEMTPPDELLRNICGETLK